MYVIACVSDVGFLGKLIFFQSEKYSSIQQFKFLHIANHKHSLNGSHGSMIFSSDISV